MKRKTLYLNVMAAALLVGAGTVHAKESRLENAIRVQANAASQSIQAETRANLREMPLIVYVPGVEIGEIKVVEAKAADAGPRVPFETTAVDTATEMGEALRRDLAAKALEVPGLFGVYRYMANTALNVAIIVAE